MEAEIAQYRAAGQPVYIEEFNAALDAVPDDLNAAVLYEKAISVLNMSLPSGVGIEGFMDEPSLFERDMASAEALFMQNAETLALIREARGRSNVAWSDRLDPINPPLNMMGGQRNISRLLWFSAGYQVHRGNHAEAIENLHDFFAFTDAIIAHPTLLAQLVGWACDHLAVSWLEAFGTRLNYCTEDTEVGCVGRDQVDALILRLQNEERIQTTFSHSLIGERAYAIGFIQHMVTVTKWFDRALFGPIDTLETLRYSNDVAHLRELIAEAYLHSVNRNLGGRTVRESFVRRLARPYSDFYWDSRDRSTNVVSLLYSTLARRRIAVVALAILQFRADVGNYPESLEVLVPLYLASLPIDPFSATDEPLKYKAWTTDGPLLYSVWEDGKDDGGTPRKPQTRLGDIVFYLEGAPALQRKTSLHSETITTAIPMTAAGRTMRIKTAATAHKQGTAKANQTVRDFS